MSIHTKLNPMNETSLGPSGQEVNWTYFIAPSGTTKAISIAK